MYIWPNYLLFGAGFVILIVNFGFFCLLETPSLKEKALAVVSLGSFSAYIIISMRIFGIQDRKSHRKLCETRSKVQTYLIQTALPFRRRGLRWVLSKCFPTSFQLWEDGPLQNDLEDDNIHLPNAWLDNTDRFRQELDFGRSHK